ncbi:origin recognition complex subunit 1 [Zeugodacus cucurbitae]|uniref:origin recognition complex subunit 1 n=1 Tax=Zeugodacus cucurbitae TaxID=28588 RepID=UPI0023D90E3D|nr:origin recognition complex subunit 1 [Zeugodacus cucurbitae]
MVLKENKLNGPPVVKWIGNHTDTVVDVPRLIHKEVNFYQKCIFGDLTLSLGDFVLVSNADAAEPDTVDGCDIAKILHLYELHESVDRDPYRAIVQWYSRPECVPHKEFDRDDICIDFGTELIEEYRPYDSDISLETIFRKCIVLFGRTDESANAILHKYNGKHKGQLMFVCRYKFIKDKKSYKIVPLEWNTNVTNAQTESRARKKSCAEDSPSINTKERKTPRVSRSASTRKEKVDGSTAVRKRRASVAAAAALEFIDCNVLQQEHKVSPIKIIGGRNVIRLSAKKKISTPNNEMDCVPTSPLTERNRVDVTPTTRVTAARRNLNLSLDTGADTSVESDCLNYSIVKTPTTTQESTNDMKIKLRLSAKQRKTKLAAMDEQFNDPLSINVEIERVTKSTPEEIYSTPTKRSKGTIEETEMTPTTRRKSILKSAVRRTGESTPKRSIQLSDVVEKRVFNNEESISTPKRKPKSDDNDIKRSAMKNAAIIRRRNSTTAVAGAMTPSQKLKMIRRGELSPTMENRPASAISTAAQAKKSDLQLARERLHVSVVPQSLPCREKEFDNVYAFLEGKIEDQCGGCMYVSGVPGTGKTATVTGVIRMLQRKQENDELPPFEFVEINGMRLTEPRQAYVQIYKQLTGKTVSWEQAHTLLEKRFTTPAPRRVTTVLLVDELDILCNRRQDVVYNLLDWPTKSAAHLVVITIANTMDLPERLLMGKVTSRLGLTRLTFQPYTHKQLQEIVTMRLSGSEAFKSDAVQLVARKVAAVSGDARRALDICRRATEIAEAAILPKDSDNAVPMQKFVGIAHVQQALSEMIASAKVQAIKNCSCLEQIFLQAVLAEVTRTGVEETSFMGVYTQVESLAAFEGIKMPTPGNCLRICSKLCAERLLIAECGRNDIFQKILLNVSVDDIHYALRVSGI